MERTSAKLCLCLATCLPHFAGGMVATPASLAWSHPCSCHALARVWCTPSWAPITRLASVPIKTSRVPLHVLHVA